MPFAKIEVHDLPARFSEMVSLAREGTEVILTEGNLPQARLIPIPPQPARIAGLHAGTIQTTDDFDAPLPEGYWTGRRERET